MGIIRSHRHRVVASIAIVLSAIVGVSHDTPTPTAEAAYPGDIGPLAFTKIARNPGDPLGTPSQRVGVLFPNGGQDDILPPNVCSGSLQELSDPAVSPDGNRVAFMCVGPFNNQIWTYTFDYSITFGARYTQVTSDSHPIRNARQPTWTPDGNSIIYTATNLATNNIQLFSSPRDGLVAPTPFAGPNVLGAEPTFAPAGDQVLLWNDVSDTIQLYEPATGTIRTVFRNPQPGQDSLTPGQIFAGQSLRDTLGNGNPFVNGLEPNWAPDSRSFTFNCGFLGNDLEENNGQVCQIGSDGTGLRLVTQFDGIWTYGGSSFSATGAQIVVSAFNALGGVSPRIYVFPSTGQTAAPTTPVVAAEQATDTHFQPDAGPAVGTQIPAPGSIAPTPVPATAGGGGGGGGDGGGTGGGTSSSEIVSVDPARFVDTRTGQTTIDGTSQALGPIDAGQEIIVQITGRNGIPNNATAAVLNITAIKPTGTGYFTIYPCGTQRPAASSLNYAPGDIIGNEIITKLSTTGTTCIYSQATTNITADLTGYIPTD